MTYIFRPGQSVVTDSALARVYQAGGALPWWNPDGATPTTNVGAWRAKGAASLAASYVNLATLGHANIDPAIVGGVAPTWAGLTGWTFNGATQYLDSGVIPANTGTWSAIIRFNSTSIVGTRGVYGIGGAPRFQFGFLVSIAGANPRYSNLNFHTTLGAGLLGPATMAVAGQNAYLNGVFISVLDAPYAEITTGTTFIGAVALPEAGVFFSGYVSALAIYNVTLTAAQVLARYNAMAAL